MGVLLVAEFVPLVVVGLVAGAAASLFRPVLFAGLPRVVSDEQLPRANGLLQSAENAMVPLGPVLGGACSSRRLASISPTG